MPAFDMIIRNGTIVDGTGDPPFTGDIAIKDGLIAQVGEVRGDAARGNRRGGQDRHSRLRRHSHALRWPGDLGPGNGALELARRDHRGDGQLRRRLRARACPTGTTG